MQINRFLIKKRMINYGMIMQKLFLLLGGTDEKKRKTRGKDFR